MARPKERVVECSGSSGAIVEMIIVGLSQGESGRFGWGHGLVSSVLGLGMLGWSWRGHILAMARWIALLRQRTLSPHATHLELGSLLGHGRQLTVLFVVVDVVVVVDRLGLSLG